MIVGVSGVRADVIPFGFGAWARSADLVGLNVVGMRRRGVRASRNRIAAREAYQALFFGEATFADRLEQVAATMPAIAHGRRRSSTSSAPAKRPLTMAGASAAELGDEAS